MNLVAGHTLFHTAPVIIPERGVVHPDGLARVSDFYCPLPSCDCRQVLFVVRRERASDQLAAIYHAFDHGRRDSHPSTDSLSDQHVQGPDAASWIAPVRAAVCGSRDAISVYESRYLEVRAAGIDPKHPLHVTVRQAAGLPLLLPPRSEPATKGRARTAGPRPVYTDLAAPLLRLRNVDAKLTGSELLVLAMALAPAPRTTIETAVAVLHAHGLPTLNDRKLVQRIMHSARDTGWFSRPADDEVRRLPDALLLQRLHAIRDSPALRDAVRALATAPAVTKPAANTPAKPAAKSTHAAKTRAAATAPVTTQAPPVTPAPEVPPPATFASVPLVLPRIEPSAFVPVLDAPRASVDSVRLCIDAWRLSFAAQFDELLALASMRGITPFAYQTETVRRVLRVLRGRGILADEVGLGKTVEAMMVLREYQVRGMAKRVLVLVPAPLVAQWQGELAEKAGVTARTTDEPAVRTGPEAFWTGDGVVVASLALARTARHAEIIQSVPWDLVIVDEAHHIKNRTTLGWKLVNALRQRFLLLVTATPVENDLEEIYNLVTLLRPGQFGTPTAFRKRFIDPKDPTRPRDREALRTLLAEVMVRNTRAQSGLALPPRFVSTVTVEPSAGERALYEAVLAFTRKYHGESSLRMAATSLLLEAGSSPRAVRATVRAMREKRTERSDAGVRKDLDALARAASDVHGTRKLDALLQVVATQRDPVLVFTRFRETLDEVVAGVTGAGVTAVPFHGGLDERGRRAALERFREGGAVVMVATAAGSEGHNLQHCNVLVNFDLPWNPMAIEQRIGRLHRMGQTRDVHVYNLCAKGTIEERVLDVLDRRVQLFQLVVGEMDMVLGNMADERDLEDWLVSAVAGAKNDADVDATFDRLAEDLLAARGRYEKTRALDEALFGKDFEA